MLVTYLPTVLMNLINQATNYIDNNFDLLLTINITCMMVLASVYVSVSNNLPLTAEIKYVEIWLLFNLAYPVMVILINIILKVRLLSFTSIILVFQNVKHHESNGKDKQEDNFSKPTGLKNDEKEVNCKIMTI